MGGEESKIPKKNSLNNRDITKKQIAIRDKIFENIELIVTE